MSGSGRVYSDILSTQAEKKPGPQSEKYNLIRQAPEAERISEYTWLLHGQRLGGSMTVEAALLLPLFWYFLAGFLYLLLLFRLQEDIGQGLADAGRELGQYAYAVQAEGNKGQQLSLVRVRQKLGQQCQDWVALGLVEGGLSGIRLGKSRIMEEDARIELTAEYRVPTPWLLLGQGTILVRQRQMCRAWTGMKGGISEGEWEEMVYVTPYGEVYHNSMDCHHLKLSIQMTSLEAARQERNKNGERYQACGGCCKNSSEGSVYVTDYGNRYHKDLNCSGLKRTVYLVFASEAQGRGACKSCGGGT